MNKIATEREEITTSTTKIQTLEQNIMKTYIPTNQTTRKK